MNNIISIIIFVFMFIIKIFMSFFGVQHNKVDLQGGSKIEKFNQPMLNIYDQPLEKCQGSGMSSGSWDNEGKCSELGGGVHQICIKNIASNTPEFSSKTGQSNWSDNRGDDNHCVCLGAWSLYNAQGNNQNKKVLKCDAIPKVSFSKDYVSKFSQGWNKWNGLELNNQIKNGVESLFENCYISDNDDKSQKLKKNYCEFASTVPVLKNSSLYKKHCN